MVDSSECESRHTRSFFSCVYYGAAVNKVYVKHLHLSKNYLFVAQFRPKGCVSNKYRPFIVYRLRGCLYGSRAVETLGKRNNFVLCLYWVNLITLSGSILLLWKFLPIAFTACLKLLPPTEPDKLVSVFFFQKFYPGRRDLGKRGSLSVRMNPKKFYNKIYNRARTCCNRSISLSEIVIDNERENLKTF